MREARMAVASRSPASPIISPDGATITLTLPFTVQSHKGRKLIVTPEGAPDWVPIRPRPDNAMIKALARGRRWQAMIDPGEHGSIIALAKAEGVNKSYLSRVLRLALLAPDIVEAILDGRQPATLQLAQLLNPFPLAWPDQRVRFGF